MNFFKRIYCRLFQKCFYVALPFLPYRKPKIYNNILDVVSIVKDAGYKSIILVVGKTMAKSNYTTKLKEEFANNQIVCNIFDNALPNPTVNNVLEAFEFYKENKCECIVAFGGGSSMDCAKVLGAKVAYPKKKISQFKGVLNIKKKIPMLIAIPTTAGTGSEVTIAAVITDSEKKDKYAIASFPLTPSYAILDPEVTRSLPPHLTSTTGMDALTHAVEAYIGKSTTKETRKNSIDSVKLIFENILLAYENGDNIEARKNMLYASYLAGLAFTKSYVGYVHAVAHSIGGQYNVSHGLANAVILPKMLRYYGKSVHKKLYKLAIECKLCGKEVDKKTAALLFINKIEELNEKMNIPTHILEIKKEEINYLAKHAEKEANPLYPVPKLFDVKDLENFYYFLVE